MGLFYERRVRQLQSCPGPATIIKGAAVIVPVDHPDAPGRPERKLKREFEGQTTWEAIDEISNV